MSKADLILDAKNKGYRPEILEKVYRLLDLLEQFMAVPYLKERLVLKGGTAINLFYSDHLPRLSIDLDFNYIGSTDREIMRAEKATLKSTLIDITERRKYTLYRSPRAHAGGKMIFVYQSVMGNKGYLEVDLNFLFRIPLWNITQRQSRLKETTLVDILDKHELAAGKLHALLGRQASRDLFDSHQLLTQWEFDSQKLRLAFTVYAAMEQDHWQRISPDNIQFSVKDIRDKLIPVLNVKHIPSMRHPEIESWANSLVAQSKAALSAVLPFNDNEKAFLEQLQKFGVIKPELLSTDDDFCQRACRHPLLIWRAKKALALSE
ncbi:MAG: hypothetical protein A3F10_05775 [Coxiella sp. RIFCSPHIGHO2_12_FULL_42_15]|nr:MAG: hypothetical protein A3F10_05775 [Coxiella sp. RIFCSPHIGHO2_12_FULL_42_15]